MRSLAALALLTIVAAARAQEVEPNNSKATATTINLVPGGGFNGNATPPDGADPEDYYHLNIAASAPGIYLNELSLYNSYPATPTRHIGTMFGLAQSGGVIDPNSSVEFQKTNVALQMPNTTSVFYTFGAPTSLDYRVAGTNDYLYTYYYTRYNRVPAEMADLGTFAAGTITMSASGSNDSSLLVLDGDYRPIPGYSNDDSAAGGGATTLSYLRRSYAPGTYYLAASRGALATNLSAAPDDLAQNKPVLPYGGMLATTSTSNATYFNLTIADANRSVPLGVGASTVRSRVDFYRFTVAQPVPEPATLAALGLGALGLLRRRRSA